MDAFLEDAELHLIEGEKGKDSSDIFGDSPKEYAEELAKEMEKDKREHKKYFRDDYWYWWILVTDKYFIWKSDQQFTLTNVQLIGYPIVLIITIIGTIVAFRMSSLKVN